MRPDSNKTNSTEGNKSEDEDLLDAVFAAINNSNINHNSSSSSSSNNNNNNNNNYNNNNNTYEFGPRINEILWNQLRRSPEGIVISTIGVIVAYPPESPEVLAQLQAENFTNHTNIDPFRNHQENYNNTEAELNTTFEEQEEPMLQNLQQYPVVVPTQRIAEIHGESSIHKEYANHDIHYPDHKQPDEED